MAGDTLETLGRDMDQVVERTQKLVDQYHEVTVDLAKVRQEADSRVATLAQEFVKISSRIPEKLNEKIIEMHLTLGNLATEVKQLHEDLKQDYVNKREFDVLKVEHDQVKRLVYGFVTLALTALAVGLIALVFKGQ